VTAPSSLPLDFRKARRFRFFNRLLVVGFSLSLFVGLNILGYHHFNRIDLNDGVAVRLAPETRARLANLTTPVQIILTLPRATEQEEVARIYRDIEGLLREMQFASRQPGREMLEVEFIDIFRQRRRAQEIMREFGLEQENAILVAAGERRRAVNAADLYRVAEGRPVAFQGEQVFLSAILDVLQPSDQVAYFLTGHGEMRTDDPDPFRGLTLFQRALRERNILVQSLDLTRVNRIPQNASLVVVAAPQVPFLRAEREKLRQYLENQQGRLMLFLEPGLSHGLNELLLDWGILSEDLQVVDSGPDFRLEGGDLIIRRFAEHPITEFLIQFQLGVIVGAPRPVREDPGLAEDSGLVVSPLLSSSETSWAARSLDSRRALAFDPNRDLPGPFTLGVVSERTAGSSLGIYLPGGRLAVFGTPDLISNNRFNALGNRLLATNAAFWMIDRDTLMNIPPRQIRSLQITVSEGQQRKLLLALLAIPGATLLLGGAVALIRR
jgi:hypothetical protein